MHVAVCQRCSRPWTAHGALDHGDGSVLMLLRRCLPMSNVLSRRESSVRVLQQLPMPVTQAAFAAEMARQFAVGQERESNVARDDSWRWQRDWLAIPIKVKIKENEQEQMKIEGKGCWNGCCRGRRTKMSHIESKRKKSSSSSEKKKKKSSSKSSASSSTASLFTRVEAECTVAVSPYYASSDRLFNGIAATLSKLLMT